jgi:hypothetical protein
VNDNDDDDDDNDNDHNNSSNTQLHLHNREHDVAQLVEARATSRMVAVSISDRVIGIVH